MPTTNVTRAPYTLDQIANYLTNGYWSSIAEGPRSFQLDGTRTLTVDLAWLSPLARAIAQTALQSWGAATGISIIDTGTYSFATAAEIGDAAGSTGLASQLNMDSVLSGRIGFGGDNDYYRVTLVAGETYTFETAAGASGAIGNTVLNLLDASGTNIVTNDDAAGSRLYSSITYTATSTGTYYINVRGSGGQTGNYQLYADNVSADIVFSDTDEPGGAYATSDMTGSTIDRSYINIPDSWDALTMNGYMLQTYIHEIGHALGLGHAGPYNGAAAFGTSNVYDNDSWLTTVMSYFSQEDNTIVPGSLAYLASIMPADMIAIQNLYGAGASGSQAGNTIWGPGGNLDNALQIMLNMAVGITPTNSLYWQNNPLAYMIYDTGGVDTIDMSAFTMKQEILLSELQYSDLGGLVDNVVIARGTLIENATGGAGDDDITGNHVANALIGNNGADKLYGLDGDDALIGGLGADRLDGGDGINDIAYYTASSLGVTVNLANNVNSGGDAQGDTLFGVEHVLGSQFADTITGDAFNNVLYGQGGADILSGGSGADSLFAEAGDDAVIGGAGADSLDGGLGSNDTAYYNASAGGVIVNLTTNGNLGSDAQGDTLVAIEHVMGSIFGDSLTGDGGTNVLFGIQGNDTMFGEAGVDYLYGGDDNDTLLGGAGGDLIDGGSGAHDIAFYSNSTAAVIVNLTTNSNGGGEATGDYLVGVEHVFGSGFGDSLTGDAGINALYGQFGADTLSGLGGTDYLYGGDGDDAFFGGDGADYLDGGAGANDIAYYTASTSGVTVNLATNVNTGGEAQGDTLVAIENVFGSSFDDVITGGAGANVLFGFNGNDTLNGGSGNDVLIGGLGADTFRFGELAMGVDVITDFQDGSDILSVALSLETTFSGLTVSGNGTTSVVVTGLNGVGNTIVVQGASPITLTAADFIFVG